MPKQRLFPRKKPVQARSNFTVEAIFDASIQVLIELGIERLTTTRVADRCGVSVGTLYQYFPNKDALLAAVLERHLLKVVEAVEQVASQSKKVPIGDAIKALVQAFFDAKFANPAASRALYALVNRLDGLELVLRLTQRTQISICEMLASAPDYRFANISSISYVLATSMISPVQGLLTSEADHEAIKVIQSQLTLMLTAYLLHVGTPA
jgi:AcrR family transcriptional regulator